MSTHRLRASAALFVLLGSAALWAASPTGAWSLVDIPNPNLQDQNALALGGVSCASRSDCWAVGSVTVSLSPQPLLEHWNGSAWQLGTFITPGADSALGGVDCTSANACWAVGGYVGAGVLVARWNGTAWVTEPTPVIDTVHAGSNNRGSLGGVHCVSASDCWAVGAYLDANSIQRTLAEHWNGVTWSIVATPVPATDASHQNYLQRVTCLSASDCWAVGGYEEPTAPVLQPHTLLEHWNGAAWSIAASPNVPDIVSPGSQTYVSSVLTGISCISSANCWAAGYSDPNGVDELDTLFEHWDGTRWTIVAAPETSAPNNYFTDVTCVSASLCWAVGGFENVTADQTMIARWDGVTWTIVPTPNQPSSGAELEDNFLHAVTCASASDCWTVGEFSSVKYDFGPYQPLALRFISPNLPPIANAGADFAVNENSAANLHGAGTDPDAGDALTYQWQQLRASGDPAVTLAGADQADANFTAPAVSADRVLNFRLTVTDSSGAPASDDVAVTVRNTDPASGGGPVPSTAATDPIGNNYLGGGSGALPLSTLLLGFLLSLVRRRTHASTR